jgi:hypothetical protein
MRELRGWRWAWLGVATTIVVPPFYLCQDSQELAVFSVVLGLGCTVVGRSTDHEPS